MSNTSRRDLMKGAALAGLGSVPTARGAPAGPPKDENAYSAAGPAGSMAARTLCAIQSWYAEQLDDARVDKILSDRIRLDYPERLRYDPGKVVPPDQM